MSAMVQDTVPRTSLAILTMPDPERGFRGNHANFIDLIQMGKSRGVFVFVVTSSELAQNKKRIRGHVYNADTDMWTRQLLPFPQVIYNRIPTRTDEQQPEVSRMIADLLKNKKAKLFNPYFFNKWTLFEWLNKTKETKGFIPATKKLSSPFDLAEVIRSHPMVYLKPIRGKAGKGIMKLETGNLGGRFWCKLSVQDNKKSIVASHFNFSKLWTRIKQETASDEYIIQQGIHLAESNERPFDLRVLMQKNELGKWRLTGIGARVAGNGSITTHVPRGGHIDNPERALLTSFGHRKTPVLMKKLEDTSLIIAKRIEKAAGYALGEMSLDLGVDKDGRIWFFEANSRPMKFDEPEIRRKSLERIIEYSHYLSQTKKKSG